MVDHFVFVYLGLLELGATSFKLAKPRFFISSGAIRFLWVCVSTLVLEDKMPLLYSIPGSFSFAMFHVPPTAQFSLSLTNFVAIQPGL